MPQPDYLERTRAAWEVMSEDFVEPGRRAWESPSITWGIWDVPESKIGALGELGSLRGIDVVELGCGTAYFSSWLARLGARVIGIDPTPKQLETARAFQSEFGIEFPLVEGYAEDLPFSEDSFDLAISEYGASIWADPYLWVPEAARVLKPGGKLVFLRNGTIATLCTPSDGPAVPELQRDYFGLHRIEWNDDEPEEFHLPTGPMLRLLRTEGFEVEDLIDIQAPEGAQTRFEYVTAEWARRWPSEEIWVCRKRS